MRHSDSILICSCLYVVEINSTRRTEENVSWFRCRNLVCHSNYFIRASVAHRLQVAKSITSTNSTVGLIPLEILLDQISENNFCLGGGSRQHWVELEIVLFSYETSNVYRETLNTESCQGANCVVTEGTGDCDTVRNRCNDSWSIIISAPRLVFRLSFVNLQRAKDGTHVFCAKYRYVFVA